jgi:hypothetical protein
MRAIPPIILGAVLVFLYALTSSRGLIADRFVLTQSDVDGFTQFIPGEAFWHCPFWGSLNPEVNRQTDLECRESAISSFVTNIAFADGGGWEDALEASRSVPFVASHHGTFEVNDVAWVFSTPEVAHRYYLLFTDSNDLSAYSSWEVLPSPTFGDESVTTRTVMTGSYPPVKEPELLTTWRRGRVITTLNAYGSSDQDPALLLRLAALLDRRIQQQGQ